MQLVQVQLGVSAIKDNVCYGAKSLNLTNLKYVVLFRDFAQHNRPQLAAYKTHMN